MSFLSAPPEAPWPLERSFQALGDSARRASSPGGLWAAGLTYQFLAFGWAFGALVALTQAGPTLPKGLRQMIAGAGYLSSTYSLSGLTGRFGLWILLVLLPIGAVVARLAAGLARISPAERWEYLASVRPVGFQRSPTMRQAWRAGKGHTRTTMALWGATLLMIFLASALFLVPARIVTALSDGTLSILAGLLSGCAVLMAMMYGLMLAVVFQLSLHSVVHNRRGVPSALLHAWRLVRNDPGATARSVVTDLVLVCTSFVVQLAMGSLAYLMVRSVFGEGFDWLVWPILLVGVIIIESFIGTTRAGFWARAYFGLGGVTTRADAFPGIEGPHVDEDPASSAAVA
tara:strand:+ start:9033 stop:10064 length:1032 start_codon:yes stop_codon:yes gene_type:complete